MTNSSQDASPVSVGRYLLHDRIGSGQYGDVYRGYDPVLKRDVAIKLPSSSIQQHELKTLLEAFQKEAELAARFIHPNIVAVYDVGAKKPADNMDNPDYSPHYLVMEYVDGVDLKSYLRQNGRLALQQALDVVYHCCMALDYVHFMGVIHRDVKPGNILFNPHRGICKLTDFGIADTTDMKSSKNMGSLSYMSPEHFQPELPLSCKSDIFALGSVMYELLAGQPAFAGNTPRDVAERVQQVKPPPIRRYCPDLPEDLENVLQVAMHSDPEKRYADALAFARALREVDLTRTGSSHGKTATMTEQVSRYLNMREDSWFRHFAPDQISELLTVTRSCDYRCGDYIVREGEQASEFYIIVSGSVAIEKNSQYLTTLKAGESFGEMGIQALLNARRTADVRAETDTCLLAVNDGRLELLSDSTRASLYRVFLEATMKRMSGMTAEVMKLRKHLPEEI